MNNVELIASYWTLAGGAIPHTDHEYCAFDFRDRVEAAARAGFKGMGFWHADLEQVRQKWSLADMKQIFDDNGIKHIELEFITDWFTDGERRRVSDTTRKLLLDAAETLSARHIKIGDFSGDPCPMERLVGEYAALCAEGAARGTRVIYELIPWKTPGTLADAVAMIEQAGAPNGGLMLDLWHVVSLKIPYAEIAVLPRALVRGVELNDGPIEIIGDWTDATVNYRQLCGHGEFDINGFIAALDRLGYDGPVGIEVLNRAMRAWPLETIVKEAYRTTITQF